MDDSGTPISSLSDAVILSIRKKGDDDDDDDESSGGIEIVSGGGYPVEGEDEGAFVRDDECWTKGNIGGDDACAHRGVCVNDGMFVSDVESQSNEIVGDGLRDKDENDTEGSNEEEADTSDPVHSFANISSSDSISSLPELQLVGCRHEMVRKPYDFQTTPTVPSDREALFRERMLAARTAYVSMVAEALKELNLPPTTVAEPPVFERMMESEMTAELASFGFRYTTRASAIDKLTRCWAARDTPRGQAVLGVAEFIRKRSRYYEQIITYQPVQLAALFRELTDSGVAVSINGLRKLLDDEGAAFIDEDGRR